MAISTRAAMESINPATGQSMGRFPHTTPAVVDRALDEARAAFLDWRQTSLDERARLLRAAAADLRADGQHLARLIAEEMGKPIVEAEAEIAKCATCCDFYAERAAGFLADQPHPSPAAAESYVVFDPLGVVLAAMPWNFPFWQVFRFAAPALMAGNVALLKHASNVPRCALAIEEVFARSGFPRDVFRTLLIPGSATDDLIGDRRIAAVTVTGSVRTGGKVGAAAGAAIKKVVLELGGSDPFIVLADADLDAAVETGIRARFRNAGQSCIAAKRFLVEGPVFDEFVRRFVEAARDLRVGNPLDRTTQMGPLARADLRDALHAQVQDTVRQGARVLLGGRPLPGPGFFYEPTVLTDVTPAMRAFKEETFGPLAALVRVRDADEAVRLANLTQFGLGADLWTRDVERAKRLARLIEAGQVYINDMVTSDPHVPFGGVKHSGHGRELSEFGIREFTNVKTVWVGRAASSGEGGRATE